MKKAIGYLLLFIAFSAGAWAQQGAEALVVESAAYLGVFFKDKFDVQVAVVHFENESELGDPAMQKIYQMLISRLEGEKNIRLVDLLVGFSNGRGEFNLGQSDKLDFLLDLKLIQNKNRTGLGLTVFSRLQDRIVAVKYFEKALSQGEMELLQTRNLVFSSMGFSKLLEFESKKNLMDIQSIAGADGRVQYFFYYPDEIIIYMANETRLEKHFRFDLKWSRPFYPALHPEGKLLLFRSAQDLVLTAGNNFCPYSQVLTFRDGQWQEAGQVDFVPFRLVTMNQNPYLVGGRYEEGRNFFKNRVYFLPFTMPITGAGAYQKQTCPAMAMDFSAAEGQLQSIHVIDRDYGYRLFNSGFEEMKPLTERKGASLAALEGRWLAMSDHRRVSDQLFFFDIRDGGLRQVYVGQVDGEVQFIAAGNWQEARGFWAGVRQSAPGAGMERLLVQFWGRRDE